MSDLLNRLNRLGWRTEMGFRRYVSAPAFLALPWIVWAVLLSALWRLWGVLEHRRLWWAMIAMLLYDSIVRQVIHRSVSRHGLDGVPTWIDLLARVHQLVYFAAVFIGMKAHFAAGRLQTPGGQP